MRPIFLVSACGLALTALAGCGPSTPPTARVALDCPAGQGELRLKTVAPDKKTCDYVTEDGDQVQLRLIPVSTSYEAALQPIEQELAGEQITADQAAASKSADAATTAKAGGAAATAAAKAAQEAAADAAAHVSNSQGRDKGRDHDGDDDDDKGDRVSIGTNGVTVGANDAKGDHADINLPGIHISADDDKARVNMGAIHVDAGDDGATVRVNREVRLRGEAFSRERHGFRATYILAKDNLKDGWHAVGYEAAGPKIGPITVAVFKARDSDHRVSDDLKRLVRRNGGI